MNRNNIVTIADLNRNTAVNPPLNLDIHRETLIREAENRLNNNNLSLPYLPNQQDTNLIEFLNNNLSESQIQQILSSVATRTFDNQIVDLILRNLNNDVLNTFLNLRNNTNVNVYLAFVNLLVYINTGIGNYATTVNVINETILNILTEDVPAININEELNNVARNTSDSLSSHEQTNDIARRNLNSIFYQVLNRNWGNVALNTVLLAGGAVGMFYAQPWLSPMLTLIGGRILSNNTQSNNNWLNQLESRNSSERTIGNIIDDFINIVRNFFRSL